MQGDLHARAPLVLVRCRMFGELHVLGGVCVGHKFRAKVVHVSSVVCLSDQPKSLAVFAVTRQPSDDCGLLGLTGVLGNVRAVASGSGGRQGYERGY